MDEKLKTNTKAPGRRSCQETLRAVGTMLRRGWPSAVAIVLSSLLFLTIFLRVLSLPNLPIGVELDTSYTAVMSYGRTQGLQFGTDILYTYGPLGFVMSPIYTGHAVISQVVGSFITAAAFAWILLRVGQSLSVWRSCLFFASVIALGLGDGLLPAVLCLLYPFCTRHKPSTRAVLLSALVMTLLGLHKFTGMLLAVPVLLCIGLWPLDEEATPRHSQGLRP